MTINVEDSEMLETRLKKGDMVKVIAGKEQGKTGKILRIISKKNRVTVEKLNLIKKHQKPDAKGKGGILQKEGSLHISNVMYLCGKCNRAVKIGYRVLDDGKKVRTCRKCNELLDE
jgi:large subunit ribosomal protein L24